MPGMLTLIQSALIEAFRAKSDVYVQSNSEQTMGYPLGTPLRLTSLQKWWKFNPRSTTLFFRRVVRLTFFNPGPAKVYMEVNHITPRVSRFPTEADPVDVVPNRASASLGAWGPVPPTAVPVPSITFPRALMNTFWSETILISAGINTPFTANAFAIANWSEAQRRMFATALMPGPSAGIAAPPFFAYTGGTITDPIRRDPRASITDTANYPAQLFDTAGLHQEIGTTSATPGDLEYRYLYSADPTAGDMAANPAANLNWCDYSNSVVTRFTDDIGFSFTRSSVLKRFFRFKTKRFMLPPYRSRTMTVIVPTERCNLMHSRLWPYLPFYGKMDDVASASKACHPGVGYTQTTYDPSDGSSVPDVTYSNVGVTPRTVTTKREDGYTQHWIQIRHYGQLAYNNQAGGLLTDPSMNHAGSAIQWKHDEVLQWKVKDKSRANIGKLGRYERKNWGLDPDAAHYSWTVPPAAPLGSVQATGSKVPGVPQDPDVQFVPVGIVYPVGTSSSLDQSVSITGPNSHSSGSLGVWIDGPTFTGGGSTQGALGVTIVGPLGSAGGSTSSAMATHNT